MDNVPAGQPSQIYLSLAQGSIIECSVQSSGFHLNESVWWKHEQSSGNVKTKDYH